MKKSLLLSVALATGMCMFAEPVIYSDVEFKALSPNGEFALSEAYDIVTLINLSTGEKSVLTPNGVQVYSIGMGNCLANDGTFTGNYSMSSPACVFKNGLFQELPTAFSNRSGFSNGITPDGRRICGTQAPDGSSMLDDKIQSVPVVWERGVDGRYGNPVLLPHPEKDFAGRTPQRITAIRISDDGKVIAGQIVDYGGFMTQLIVYRQAEDGSWSYELPGNDLINPKNVKFPEDPGEAPEAPAKTAFMSADELKEYNEAVQEWNDYCETTGNWDYETYPNEDDFMSDESLSNYDEAKAEYDEKHYEWSIAFLAFQSAYMKAINESCEFIYNAVYMTPDGKLMAAVNRKSINDTSFTDTPYIFNLETGTYSFNADETKSMVSGMAADGTLLVYDASNEILNAKVRHTDGTIVSLYEYMQTASPKIAEWMRENMYHDMEVYNPSTNQMEMKENVPCFGLAICTPDMGTIASTASNLWFDDMNVSLYGYIMDVTRTNDVKVITGSEGIDISVRGDVILFSAEVADLQIYDMQGRKVYTASDATEFHTCLGRGVYVVTATLATGEHVSIKIAL